MTNETMKLYLVIVVGITSMLAVMHISACKKDAVINGRGKVKTSIYCTTANCDTTTYTYDDQGRIHSTQSDQLAPVYYTYFKDSVCTNDDYHSTYALNSGGLATYRDLHYNYLRESYTYDADGFKIHEDGPTGDKFSFLIVNGDILANSYYVPIQYSGGGADDTTFHTYYTDLEMRDYGMSFLGKTNIHLVKTDTISWHHTDRYGTRTDGIFYRQHFYSFDAQHRVIEEHITGADSSISYFTYY